MGRGGGGGGGGGGTDVVSQPRDIFLESCQQASLGPHVEAGSGLGQEGQ